MVCHLLFFFSHIDINNTIIMSNDSSKHVPSRDSVQAAIAAVRSKQGGGGAGVDAMSSRPTATTPRSLPQKEQQHQQQNKKEEAPQKSFLQNMFGAAAPEMNLPNPFVSSSTTAASNTMTELPRNPSMTEENRQEENTSKQQQQQQLEPVGSSSAIGAIDISTAPSQVSVFDKVEQIRQQRLLLSGSAAATPSKSSTSLRSERTAAAMATLQSSSSSCAAAKNKLSSASTTASTTTPSLLNVTTTTTTSAATRIPAAPSLSMDDENSSSSSSSDDDDDDDDLDKMLPPGTTLAEIGAFIDAMSKTTATATTPTAAASGVSSSLVVKQESPVVAPPPPVVNQERTTTISTTTSTTAERPSSRPVVVRSCSSSSSSSSDDDDEALYDAVPEQTQSDVLSFLEQLEQKKQREAAAAASQKKRLGPEVLPSVPSGADDDDDDDHPKPMMEDPPTTAPSPRVGIRFNDDDDDDDELLRLRSSADDGDESEAAPHHNLGPSFSVETLQSDLTYNFAPSVSSPAAMKMTMLRSPREEDDDGEEEKKDTDYDRCCPTKEEMNPRRPLLTEAKMLGTTLAEDEAPNNDQQNSSEDAEPVESEQDTEEKKVVEPGKELTTNIELQENLSADMDRYAIERDQSEDDNNGAVPVGNIEQKETTPTKDVDDDKQQDADLSVKDTQSSDAAEDFEVILSEDAKLASTTSSETLDVQVAIVQSKSTSTAKEESSLAQDPSNDDDVEVALEPGDVFQKQFDELEVVDTEQQEAKDTTTDIPNPPETIAAKSPKKMPTDIANIIRSFTSLEQLSSELPQEEQRVTRRFLKLIAPVIDGHNPSIVEVAQIRQAAKKAKVSSDDVEEFLKFATSRHEPEIVSKTSEEWSKDLGLEDDMEDLNEDEQVTGFLERIGDLKSFDAQEPEGDVQRVDSSQLSEPEENMWQAFGAVSSEVTADEDDDEAWWQVSGRPTTEESRNDLHGSSSSEEIEDQLNEDQPVEAAQNEGGEDAKSSEFQEDQEQDEDDEASSGSAQSSSRREPLSPPGRSPHDLEFLRSMKSFDCADEDDIWRRKNAMARYGKDWAPEKAASWLSSPRKEIKVPKPEPIDGTIVSKCLRQLARGTRKLPFVRPWQVSYQERTAEHSGYSEVDVYSMYDAAVADHGELDEIDVAPWEHRDVQQNFLDVPSISLNRNWFGALVFTRGNDKNKAPVCKPKSMEMPMDNVPDFTEDWYTNNKRINLVSRSESTYSSSDEEDDNSQISNRDAESMASGSGSLDSEEDSWEELPECGLIINVRQKIGERVSRIHPDHTSSLRRSRWRKKYFPRGTFPY